MMSNDTRTNFFMHEPKKAAEILHTPCKWRLSLSSAATDVFMPEIYISAMDLKMAGPGRLLTLHRQVSDDHHFRSFAACFQDDTLGLGVCHWHASVGIH
jgi:hypothetical protein